MSRQTNSSNFTYLPHILRRLFVHEVATPLRVDPQLAGFIRQAQTTFISQLTLQARQQFNGRLERGLELALNGSIHPAPTPSQPHRYEVLSSHGDQSYMVDLDDRHCECPDSQKGNHCKHRIAAYYYDQALQLKEAKPKDQQIGTSRIVFHPLPTVDPQPQKTAASEPPKRTEQVLKDLGFDQKPKKEETPKPQTGPGIRLGSLYSKYLHGEDLCGKSFEVKITRVTHEKVMPRPGQPASQKWCLWVTDLPDWMPKGIFFGSQGEKELVAIFGRVDLGSLVGKSLTVYPNPVTVGGEIRMAIRFRGVK